MTNNKTNNINKNEDLKKVDKDINKYLNDFFAGRLEDLENNI